MIETERLSFEDQLAAAVAELAQSPDARLGARLLVRRHGRDAARAAAERAGEMLQAADRDGFIAARAILVAILRRGRRCR